MKVAFVTTQTLTGSTVVGRILPLAHEFARRDEVHILVHESQEVAPTGIRIHSVGRDPFTRSPAGKKRLGGLLLIARLALNALKTFFTLIKLRPDIVIIVKSLPQNVLAVWLWRGFNRKAKVILDVDDFELTANALTSIVQRFAVHWAERLGARMSHTIVAASPFLQDHFEQLSGNKKNVVLVPTGVVYADPLQLQAQAPALLYLGSVSLQSGHRVDLLPDILAKVRQYNAATKLTIAGSGDDMENLKEVIRSRGLESAVTWKGRFSSDDIPQLLSEAPILVDPIDTSIVNRAKSSYRVTVAAICGLSVVSSNVGIRAMLVPAQLHERFFAEPANAESYAERIISLLQQPLPQSDQAMLHQHALPYTWEELGKKYAEYIHN